jgi:hypothetical protein
MGNVNLPTPVALAGGAICALAGYLLGVVAGPDTNSQTTATVTSYDTGTGRLCLQGDGVDGQQGSVHQGVLCGVWQRTAGETGTPRKGDEFRFVSMTPSRGHASGDRPPVTAIYGDVVRR